MFVCFYREALGVACSGDSAFADALEAFGGGHDDPVSVSIGGVVIFFFIMRTGIAFCWLFNLEQYGGFRFQVLWQAK